MEIAYRIYPLPNGTVYTEEDVKTLDDVVGIFDYCQIMEAMISKNGGSIEMFTWDIECEKKHAYDDAGDHQAITDFCESTHFPGI